MTNRLLFMHRPEEGTAQAMVGLTDLLKRGYALTGNPFPPDRLHSTLQNLGDYSDLSPALVAAARRAAVIVAVPPVEVAFDRVMTFSGGPGNRPLVLRGGAGVVPLQRAIGKAMAKVGLGAFVNRSFTPHITLLRGDGVVEEQAVETFCWTVREFVLVNSLVGQGKYVELGRWSLGGDHLIHQGLGRAGA
jgi:RNA 2',3'-cyclic 3'-phosphodiesterase